MLHAEQLEQLPAPAPAPLRVIAKAIDILLAVVVARAAWPYGWIVGTAYLLFADAFMDGRSIGKRLLGLRVVHPATGLPCSFRHSALRNFPFAIMGLLALTSLIGQIIAALIGGFSAFMEISLIFRDPHGLRVGDIVSETSVVLASNPVSRPVPVAPVDAPPPPPSD